MRTSSVPLTASSIVHSSILLYVSTMKPTTASMIVMILIKALPMARILACVARIISSFVCIARYLGRVWICAAPLAKPVHAERRDALSEVASEAVDDRFWMRWAIVRMRGRSAGERVVRSSRGGSVRYGRRPADWGLSAERDDAVATCGG
jgi:hypothetical protein